MKFTFTKGEIQTQYEIQTKCSITKHFLKYSSASTRMEVPVCETLRINNIKY